MDISGLAQVSCRHPQEKITDSPQIIDPSRFDLNEQKIAIVRFNPQGVLIPKM